MPDQTTQIDDRQIQGFKDWLKNNPDDKMAPALRQKLTSMGVTGLPDPPPSGFWGEAADYGRAFQQGVVLDPLEKVGQIAEHLPGALGRWSQQAGAAIPQSVQDYLRRNQESGERHPWVRTAGNIAPWLMVPGAGEVKAATALGGLAGLTQPLDPKDPNYWRDLGWQGTLGAITSGIFGPMTGRAVTKTEADKAAAVARQLSEAVTQFIADTPERTTRNLVQRIANEAGDASLVPRDITPQTIGQVRNAVGKKLGQIYQQLTFNPAASGWPTAANQLRDRISGMLVDPAMRSEWEQAFADDAMKPAMFSDPTHPVVPLTGDKLNQLMSHLSDAANEFGLKAQKGAGRQYGIMADGLRQLGRSIEAQFQAQNPAVAAQRRALNRAYYLSDVGTRGTTAAEGGVGTPRSYIRGWEKKEGKTPYATSSRFRSVKDMLEQERQTAKGKVQTVQPPTQAATPGSGLARRLMHLPGTIGGFKLGGMVGHPWVGAGVGTEASEAAISHLGRAAAAASRRVPGLPTAAAAGVSRAGPLAGRTASSVIPEIVVTAPRYRPGEDQENQ